jgi:hypothetical protein
MLPEGAWREKQMAAVRKNRGTGFLIMSLARKIVLQHADGKLEALRRFSTTLQISRASPRRVNPVTPD